MIAEQHRLTDTHVMAQTAGGVCQHDRAGARGARRPHAVHDLAQPMALVGVDPAQEDQHPAIAEAYGEDPPLVARHLWGWEAAEVGEAHLAEHATAGCEHVGGGPPAGAEHDGYVVPVDTGAGGEPGGRGCGIRLVQLFRHAPTLRTGHTREMRLVPSSMPGGGPLRRPRRRTPPDVPLAPGEFIEVMLRGRLTDPRGPGGLTAKAERFLGHRLGASRWVLLTTRRLLVVAPFPREGDWFDVAFDRRDVSASRGVKRGDVITVELATPNGTQVLRVPADVRSEVSRFIRTLRRRP